MKFWKFQVLENVQVPFFSNSRTQNWEQLLKSKSPLSAIHKMIWHVWEPRSRKVNNNEPGLRFFHGNFWPVMSRAVRKPCFSTPIPRGQIPRFPDAARAGGAAGRILKSRSRPLPTHPGMKYFREETLAVDLLTTAALAIPRRRSHWPTKENKQNFVFVFDFFGLWRKRPWMASNGAGKVFPG